MSIMRLTSSALAKPETPGKSTPPPRLYSYPCYNKRVILVVAIIVTFALLALPSPADAQGGVRFRMRKREKQILDLVLSNSTYDNRIRPSPLLNSTTGETQVRVNLLIRSVSKIDDFAMEYSVQLLLREEWFDDRLNYQSHQKQTSQFSAADFPPYLTIVDTSRVWMPDIFFVNEKDGRLHKIIKPNEYVRIYPNGLVLYSVRISLVLACPMDLQFFPMDRQTCGIGMASYGLTTEDLVFYWKVEEPVQLPNLTLPRFHLEAVRTYTDDRTTNTGTYSTLKADFVLRRTFSYYMTQLYIPCIMLVIVSQVNFYIDENAAPARTGLGITTLLTMATQSASINRSLPPVSYTKSVDVWSGVCLIFVFAALIEFAFVNYYVRFDKRAKKQFQERHGQEPPPPAGCGWLSRRYPSRSKRIDVCSRVIFPLLFLIFNVAYWSICLTAVA